MDAVHRLDDVGVGLLEYEYQHRPLVVEPTRCADVLDAVDDRGDRIEPDRRSVAGGDGGRLLFVRPSPFVIYAGHIRFIPRIAPPLSTPRRRRTPCPPHPLTNHA